MSTHPPTPTDHTPTTRPQSVDASTSFALRHAKRSFDPFNTRTTPEMFDETWTAGD